MTVFWTDKISGILSDRRWMAAAVLLLAVVMTVKYYPGFENSNVYSGNAYQILNPGAFEGDPYQGPEKSLADRPFQLSSLYALVYLMGDIWLDDRFAAAFYVGLVFAGLLGVERIAAHLGLSNPLARLAVLLLMAKDHELLSKNMLSYPADVNHFACAIPLIVWLLYAALARKGWPVVLILCVATALTSPRVGVGPIFFALCLQAWNGAARDRIFVGLLFLAGLVIAYAGLFHWAAVPEHYRLELWDNIRARDHSEANPWYPFDARAAFENAVWLAHICVGLWIAVRAGGRFRAAGVVLAAGVVVWLVGGLYISASPDMLKQPLLIALAPSRMLAWPQLLATITVAAFFMMRAEEQKTPGALAAAAFAMAALYMAGPGDPVRWSGLIAVSALAAALGVIFTARRTGAAVGPVNALAARPAAVITAALIVSTAAAYSVAAVQHWPHWRTWAQHGVYGGTSFAPWIGVDSYIRENTPVNASILPYHFYKDGRLVSKRFLGARTGRAMPVPAAYSNVRNPDGFRFEAEQRVLLDSIGADLLAGDISESGPHIENLVPVPDYIIAPSSLAAGLDWAALGYAPDAETHGFMILRRNP
ncbi:MAG: hypothetical protein ACYYKD_01880 [Rhodospirillales bacterium]